MCPPLRAILACIIIINPNPELIMKEFYAVFMDKRDSAIVTRYQVGHYNKANKQDLENLLVLEETFSKLAYASEYVYIVDEDENLI